MRVRMRPKLQTHKECGPRSLPLLHTPYTVDCPAAPLGEGVFSGHYVQWEGPYQSWTESCWRTETWPWHPGRVPRLVLGIAKTSLVTHGVIYYVHTKELGLCFCFLCFVGFIIKCIYDTLILCLHLHCIRTSSIAYWFGFWPCMDWQKAW